MKFSKTISNRTKFTMLFILLILLPLLILNIVIASFQLERNTRQYITENKYIFNEIPQVLANELSVAFSYAYSIYQDYEISTFLNKNYDNYKDYTDNYFGYNIEKIFGYSSFLNTNVATPVLYTSNPTIYETEIVLKIDENLRKEVWYKKFVETGDDSFFHFDTDNRAAYIIRNLNLYPTNDFENLAVIVVDLDYVSNFLEKLNVPCSAILYGDEENFIYKWEVGYPTANTIAYYSTLSSDTSSDDVALIYHKNIDNYGEIKFCIVIEKAPRFSFEIILISAITLIVTLVASFLFMKQIQKDYIDRIENILESLNIDEYVSGDIKKSNQITIVEQTLSTMSERIRNLIKQSFDLEMEKNQAEIRRKQSELNSLLSQINPHYLFNVLNAIRLKSLLKGEKETAKIILYVSKILRQNITWNRDVITMEEEISFIKEYLAIEKYRFEDKFEFFINVENEALGCDIPKMCLQPFVENACVHGIQNILGQGTIDISVKVIDDKLQFKITNPVASFNQGVKEQIINYSKGNFEIDTKSVGLKNTFGRLRYYYSQIGFEIDTTVENQISMVLTLSTKVDRNTDPIKEDKNV